MGEPLRSRDPEALKEYETTLHADILFYEFCQFEFFKQWKKLKEYANNRGIQLIGDLPFYVALDSVDVWANRELFLLEEDGMPKELQVLRRMHFQRMDKSGEVQYTTGADGRRWICLVAGGMLEHAKLFDVIRLDHFAAIVSIMSYRTRQKMEEVESGVGDLERNLRMQSKK